MVTSRLLIFLVLLQGCEVLRPIAAVELNHALKAETNFYLKSARPWQCESPQIRLELGGETKSRLSFGIYHESMLLCGTINSKEELWEGGFFVRQELGGW